jgi:uncharacterized DUF497 family protein
MLLIGVTINESLLSCTTLLGRRLTIIFTLRDRDTRIRVISARDMNRRERATYEQAA